MASAAPIYFLTCHVYNDGDELVETHRVSVRDGQSIEDVADRFIMTMVLEEVGAETLMECDDETQSDENRARVEGFLQLCSGPGWYADSPSIGTNLEFPGLRLCFACLRASSVC